MAVNVRFGQPTTATWSELAEALGQMLSGPADAAGRAARRTYDSFAADAVTEREHIRRGIYEATGRQRGENPPDGVVTFDLVDRYRAGL